MWKKVGDVSGERKDGGSNPVKSRKSFGYGVRNA